MNRSIKILTIVNIILGIGLCIFFYIMIPFAHGVIADVAKPTGKEYPNLENWKRILYSIIPGIIIGVTTFLGVSINKRSKKKSLLLLSFFPLSIPTYILIQFAMSF